MSNIFLKAPPKAIWNHVGAFVMLLSCCQVFAQSTYDTAKVSRLIRAADAFSAAARYDSANLLYEQAVLILSRHQQWPKVTALLSDVALNNLNLEAYEEADATLRRAHEIIRERGVSGVDIVSGVHHVTGMFYYMRGDYEKAIDHMKTSLRWHLKQGKSVKPEYIASKYNNIGAISSRIGDFDEAILNYNKCLSIYLKSNASAADVGEIYNNLSASYYRKGNYGEAVRYSLQYLKILDTQPGEQMKNYIHCYNSLAICHAELGQYNASENYLTKTLKLHQTTDYMLAKTYHNLGYLYRKWGQDDVAVRYLNLAMEKNREKYGAQHPDIGKEYRHMGVIYADKGQWHAAVECYQQALTILVPEFRSKGIVDNPSLQTLLKSKPDLLRTFRDKAFALYRMSSGDGLAYMKASFHTYQKALELLDIMRSEYELEDSRQFINEEAMPIYDRAMEVAFVLYERTKDPVFLNAAFEISERSRALLLLESLQLNESRALLGVPDSVLLREKKLKRNIAFYETQVAEAKLKEDSEAQKRNREYLLKYQSKYRNLIDDLREHYPRYYRRKFISLVTLPEALQKLKGSKTAVIEYFLGAENIYVIGLTAARPLGIMLKKPASFDTMLAKYQRSISDYAFIVDSAEVSFTHYTSTAHHLYQILLEQVLNRIPPDVDDLVLVTQGAIGHLSFDALLTHKPPSMGYKSLSYLINTYNIRYAYSVSAHMKLVESVSKSSGNTCLAFAPASSKARPLAGAAMVSRNGGALPATQEEVTQIASYFPGDVYLGMQANEATFKDVAASYTMIHLATHGIADYDLPDKSRLLLGTGSHAEEDDVLYAYEINNLSLYSDMVVLSGCETGYGSIMHGEGIMSLGRSFLHAGSKSVLMSLWKVDDSASAWLMGNFYASLASGLRKSEALRRAKLNYLTQADDFSAHPIFWAAFVFIGDDRPLHNSTSWLRNAAFAFLIAGGGGLLFFVIRRRLSVS